MIAVNGRIVAQGSQFSLNDVEVISATIDIEDVRAHRAKASRSMQAAGAERYHRIEAPFALSSGKFEIPGDDTLTLVEKKEFVVRYHHPEEEIAFVPYLNFCFMPDNLVKVGTSLLVVGLSEAFSNPRLLSSAQWRYRQLCNSSNCTLHVPPSCGCI
jgi:NAD+ synthase (glutamine-hydrolysing)